MAKREKKSLKMDPELLAIRRIESTLKELSASAAYRVVQYVASRMDDSPQTTKPADTDSTPLFNDE